MLTTESSGIFFSLIQRNCLGKGCSVSVCLLGPISQLFTVPPLNYSRRRTSPLRHMVMSQWRPAWAALWHCAGQGRAGCPAVGGDVCGVKPAQSQT